MSQIFIGKPLNVENRPEMKFVFKVWMENFLYSFASNGVIRVIMLGLVESCYNLAPHMIHCQTCIILVWRHL